jgi:hypothetical protein
MEILLGLLVMIALPGYWVLQIMLVKRYDGGWRIAALAPLIAMVPLLAYTAYAFAAGSNLWPLLLIFVSPVAFVYLAIVSAVRAMV